MENLPIEYSDKPVTPFGGMALMKRFVDQTFIREFLATLDFQPSQSTSSRFFGRSSLACNTAVFPALQHRFFEQVHIGAVTVDFDCFAPLGCTVIMREGNQQGSAKGFNTNRKGCNSHHPLIASVCQTRMAANA